MASGAIITVLFWQHFAVKPEWTPDTAALKGAPPGLCSGVGHPVKAVRTDDFQSFSLYEVWCSGSRVPISTAW